MEPLTPEAETKLRQEIAAQHEVVQAAIASMDIPGSRIAAARYHALQRKLARLQSIGTGEGPPISDALS